MEFFAVSYIIKVNIAICILYCIYFLFFRNDTFFRLKRGYFLFGSAFCLTYPFLSFELPRFYVDNKIVEAIIHQVESEPVNVFANGGGTAFAWWSVLIVLAGIIGLVLLMRVLMQVLSILFLRMKYPKKQILEGVSIIYVHNREVAPFSFFRWIFLNPYKYSDKDLADIITHEKEHATQMHSVDVLLFQVVCALFWWNPFVWLIKREARLNLEYIADSKVLNSGTDAKRYQYNLVRLSYGEITAVVNNFNVSQLKKRIKMMNKEKSLKKKMPKYLLVIPCMLALICINCFSLHSRVNVISENRSGDELKEMITQEDVPDGYDVVDEMPVFPGGQEGLIRYISENLKYPPESAKKGIQGKVLIKFTISETGEVLKDKIELMQGFDPLCDAEALRVVRSMPDWTPGKNMGVAVPVFFVLPVSFSLGK